MLIGFRYIITTLRHEDSMGPGLLSRTVFNST